MTYEIRDTLAATLIFFWLVLISGAFYFGVREIYFPTPLEQAAEKRQDMCTFFTFELRHYPNSVKAHRVLGKGPPDPDLLIRLGKDRGWSKEQTLEALDAVLVASDRGERQLDTLLRIWEHACINTPISLWLPEEG